MGAKRMLEAIRRVVRRAMTGVRPRPERQLVPVPVPVPVRQGRHRP